MTSKTHSQKVIERSLLFAFGVVTPVALILGGIHILNNGSFPFIGRDLSSETGWHAYNVVGAAVTFAAVGMCAAAIVIHIMSYWYFPKPKSVFVRYIFNVAAVLFFASVLGFVMHEML
ncbi:MAG: hypothetical protein R3F03_11095 [Opitutaceae bacterium]